MSSRNLSPFFAGVAFFSAVPAAVAAPASHSVEFKVIGEEGAGSADIRYNAGAGMVSVGTQRLPWSLTTTVSAAGQESLAGKVGLYVDRASGSSGLYECQIWVDGTLTEKVERDLQEGSLVCFLGDDQDDQVDD